VNAILFLCQFGIIVITSTLIAFNRRQLNKWYEAAYPDEKTRPTLESLHTLYTVPASFSRSRFWIYYIAVLCLAVVGHIHMYSVSRDYAMVLGLIAYVMPMIFFTLGSISAYIYVNEYARRENERLARENSTSSRQ
jgi:predicted PurR-regulated permease PerM